jgi:hypothetical protein
MRQTVVVAAITAVITAIIVSWGTSVIVAHSAKGSPSVKASSSVDVMQLMKNSKNLPEERFDAH